MCDITINCDQDCTQDCNSCDQAIARNSPFDGPEYEGVFWVDALGIQQEKYLFNSAKTFIFEYKDNERVLNPYPGIDKFKKIRCDRDCCFGFGVDIDDEG